MQLIHKMPSEHPLKESFFIMETNRIRMKTTPTAKFVFIKHTYVITTRF